MVTTNDLRLETSRLILRPPALTDAQALRSIASDPRVALTTASIRHPYPAGAEQELIRAIIADEEPNRVRLAIAERDEPGTLIGLIGCHPRGADAAELTYMVSPDSWNRGIATEAAKKVIEWAFTEGPFQTIAASALASNRASERVLEKAGFRREREALCDLPVRGGTFLVSFWRLERARPAANERP